MELSKRLLKVASLVTEGASVADIGTDHGYIPIYLIEEQIASRVIALDINKGPLERARMHIASYGLESKIETRLSDGLARVEPGEVDTMIAAGMGGGLIIHILEEGKAVTDQMTYCILQPQSEIDKVRRYVINHGFRIDEEDMVKEDGKYYPMMRLVHSEGGDETSGREAPYSECEYLYGRRLLEKRHPVLKEYLQRELNIRENILDGLWKEEGERVRVRSLEIEEEMRLTRQALRYYYNC